MPTISSQDIQKLTKSVIQHSRDYSSLSAESIPTKSIAPVHLASFIDHTLLKQDAVPAQIAKLCEEALSYQFASVCVNPTHVKQCADLLKGSSVNVCTVAGFPLGANIPSVKAYETAQMIENGATEIDMVINVGMLKAGNVSLVVEDVLGVVETAHASGALVKVIIETCLLTRDEKILASLITKECGAEFVKTSTGLSTGGATVEDVALMRNIVGSDMGVKAAGGIRTRADALAMVSAGATRIGTSSGIRIIQEEATAS